MNAALGLINKALRLSLGNIFLMLTLCFVAFGGAIALSLYDISFTSLLLQKMGTDSLAFNMIIGAVFLSVAGYFAILFDRRQGYGSVPVLGIAFALIVFLTLQIDAYAEYALNLLFSMKYGLYLLFTVAFWSLARRFITIRFDSLKFTAILLSELSGFALGGVLGALKIAPTFLIANCLFFFIAALFLMLYLVQAYPIESEAFTKKQGGAQDVLGIRLIRLIYVTAFIYMMSRAAADIGLYQFALTTQNIQSYLSTAWMLFGGAGLCVVLLLRQTQYLYTTLHGLCLLCFSLLGLSLSILFGASSFILACYVLFALTSYFYIPMYFKILPRPITPSDTRRIKHIRMLLIEPAGFMLTATLFYYFDSPDLVAAALFALGLFLMLSMLRANKTYSDILLSSFAVRFWRGGPLMITNKAVLSYISDGLKNTNVNDALYFLRVLEESRHPQYLKLLHRTLSHPIPAVRSFAILKTERLDSKRWMRSISNAFENDSSLDVRQSALRVLIRFASQKSPRAVEKYLPYLDDKDLKTGALIGFLKLRNNDSLLAMDGLQKLAFSKKPSDNLAALSIMSAAPNTAYLRLLLPLLKSDNPDVLSAALLAAGDVKNAAALPFIFKALDDFDLKENALTALKNYGKGAFPPIEKMLDNPDMSLVRSYALILFLGALPSGEGKQILLRSTNIPNQKLRKAVMETLLGRGIIWIQRHRQKLLKTGIAQDVARFDFWLQFLNHFSAAPSHETEESFKFLRQSIIEDMNDTRFLILYQLMLLKPHPLFHKAISILLTDQYAHYPMAAGVVQDFLPHRLYKKLKPLLLYPTNHEPSKVQYHSTPQIVQSIAALITQPAFEIPAWIKANALYALRKLGDAHALPAVETALAEKNPLVLEAAIYALNRLEKNKTKQHARLINIPTSALTQQNLEYVLK